MISYRWFGELTALPLEALARRLTTQKGIRTVEARLEESGCYSTGRSGLRLSIGDQHCCGVREAQKPSMTQKLRTCSTQQSVCAKAVWLECCPSRFIRLAILCL